MYTYKFFGGPKDGEMYYCSTPFNGNILYIPYVSIYEIGYYVYHLKENYLIYQHLEWHDSKGNITRIVK